MLASFCLAAHKSFMHMQLLPNLYIVLMKTIRIRVTTVWVESFNRNLVRNTNTAWYQTPINIIFPENEALSNSPFMSQRFPYFASSCHHCERFQSVLTEIMVRARNHIMSWCVCLGGVVGEMKKEKIRVVCVGIRGARDEWQDTIKTDNEVRRRGRIHHVEGRQ